MFLGKFLGTLPNYRSRYWKLIWAKKATGDLGVDGETQRKKGTGRSQSRRIG